MSERLITTN